MKKKSVGGKKLKSSEKRRNFTFTVSPESEKFLRALEDRNTWLEKKIEKDTQK